MNQKTNCDKGGYSRTLLLLFMFCFSPFEISTFQIVRPTPTNFVGKDSYDQGKFVYRNQIVNVDCVTTERKEGRCVCGYGGTFVFNINNNGNLQPTCVYKYSDVFGCHFHSGSEYILAADIPRSWNEYIDFVTYDYNELRSISSIGNVSYWNITWHTAPGSILSYDRDELYWNLPGNQLSKYGGLLLKLDLTASMRPSSRSGCLLFKIAGTRTYPLTRYRSQVTSYKVTPTTSMASTQMQSPIIHVSSTATVIQSFAATSSSSSLFDHRAMSASSERFKIGSLIPSIPSVVHSLSTFDVSIKSVSSAYHRSQPHSLNVRSIASSTHAVIYSSWIKQRSNVQSTKPTPSSNQGVMKSTAVLTASSEPFHTLGRSASFKSTMDLVSKSSAVLSSVIQNGKARETSMASTQMQSQIIHVSSTATVIQSFAATSSSSSLFDHRTMSASSERFKIGSLTPSIPSVVHSLSTFDVSIKSVSSAYHRSQPHSLNVRSIASSSRAVIYSSWIKQRSNVQSTKPTPSSNQGVMKSTAVLTASSEPFHTLGRSASFKSTMDLVSKSSAVLSSVIQNGNAGDTSKQSGDDVPVIVGSLLGSLFGVVAIVMVTLLCRRKFFGKERFSIQDVLQLQISGRNYDRNGSVSQAGLQKIDNPTYGESIDMTMGPSAEKKPSLNLYESPCDGKAHKNQALDQVYSEIDERHEAIYQEVENDDPIYKEVIEERPMSQGSHIPTDPSSPHSPVYQYIAPTI